MHSEIYEITTEPVKNGEYRDESYFFDHWFIGNVADYVNGKIDRNLCIQDLKQQLNQIVDFNGDSFLLKKGGKKYYFAESFRKFKNILLTLTMYKEEDFIGGDIETKMHHLNEAFCDKSDIYVSSDEFGTIPFDEFIRNAEEGITYYIGGVIDYHY